MSLTLPQLLACLARCQAEEVAPALAEELTADARHYAAGSAGTVAMLLQLAGAEAASLESRDQAAAHAAADLLGAAIADRDARHAAYEAALVAAAGDPQRQAVLLAGLLTEAEADGAAIGLPLPAVGG